MKNTNISISVKSLKKSFQNKQILKDVNFSVHAGSIYTLLGSNGAGKTTTIRILTTQLKSDSGEVTIEGYDVIKDIQKIHEIISLTGQFSAIDESLTAFENLIIMCKLRHLHQPKQEAEKLLQNFGLIDSAHKIVSTYSGGMKRKLDIAMSLVGNPKVIFLDEPTTGLDPQSRRNMWDIIKKLNEDGVTIFLTTQYLEEAEHLADTIAILDQGKIIVEGSPAQLKSYLPQGAIQFIFENEEQLNKAKILLKEYNSSIDMDQLKITLFTDGQVNSLTQIFHSFYENNVNIQNFSQITPNLEDVFLSIINESEDKIYGKQ